MSPKQEEIKCAICKKDIAVNDEVVLGDKDNYNELPKDINADNIVFLHVECLLKQSEEKKDETSD